MESDTLPEPSPAPQRTLERLRVAFQGEFGAFGEEAIHLLWRGAAEPIPKATFEDVMSAAESRDVDYGMLPIESTLVGGLDVAYDLLSLHDGLRIVAEVIVPVHLCLLAVPGATIKSLRTLASHPVMLGQCSHFLSRYKHITPQPAWDTAGAARDVRDAGDRTRAAAGTRRAAERFELAVLMDHIEDRPDSQNAVSRRRSRSGGAQGEHAGAYGVARGLSTRGRRARVGARTHGRGEVQHLAPRVSSHSRAVALPILSRVRAHCR